LRFNDMDMMARAMISGHMEFVPLGPGSFQGQICQVDFEGFVLKRVTHAPFLIQGTIQRDQVALALPVRPTGKLTLNGEMLDASTLAVISESAAFQATCPVEQDRISLVFCAHEFDQLVASCGRQVFPRGRHKMLHLREDQARAMANTFAAMTDLAGVLPNLFVMPVIWRALKEQCLSLLADALLCEEDRRPSKRQTRKMLQQVRAADEFLHANIDRPVHTEELCSALHVSPRTLHESFATVYCMSPCAYLKRRRLVLVHRALQAARGDQVMVKSVVLAHGFWHLGRFAHEYAVLFGEMPSDTLARGQG
jgi:AraC family ethanolamine operon transcriptional activator